MFALMAEGPLDEMDKLRQQIREQTEALVAA